jgi:hypothetical protein
MWLNCAVRDCRNDMPTNWANAPPCRTQIFITLAVLFALPLGVLAAVYCDSFIDRFVVIISMIGEAAPTFWISLWFIVWFGIKLRWLPISGSGSWAHFIMPSVALGRSEGSTEVLHSSLQRVTRVARNDVDVCSTQTPTFKHSKRCAYAKLAPRKVWERQIQVPNTQCRISAGLGALTL